LRNEPSPWALRIRANPSPVASTFPRPRKAAVSYALRIRRSDERWIREGRQPAGTHPAAHAQADRLHRGDVRTTPIRPDNRRPRLSSGRASGRRASRADAAATEDRFGYGCDRRGARHAPRSRRPTPESRWVEAGVGRQALLAASSEGRVGAFVWGSAATPPKPSGLATTTYASSARTRTKAVEEVPAHRRVFESEATDEHTVPGQAGHAWPTSSRRRRSAVSIWNVLCSMSKNPDRHSHR
jgi:hypothetical protein